MDDPYETWFATHDIDPAGDMLWPFASREKKWSHNWTAYNAMCSGDVEMFDRVDGLWKPASGVSLHHQYRPKPKLTRPLVRYWVQYADGGEEIYAIKPHGLAGKVIRMVETPE